MTGPEFHLSEHNLLLFPHRMCQSDFQVQSRLSGQAALIGFGGQLMDRYVTGVDGGGQVNYNISQLTTGQQLNWSAA